MGQITGTSVSRVCFTNIIVLIVQTKIKKLVLIKHKIQLENVTIANALQLDVTRRRASPYLL